MMVKLGHVMKQIRGVSYKGSDAKDAPGKSLIPILRATNIQNRRIIETDLVYVPIEYVKEPQLLKQSDVLIAASSGSLSIVGKAAAIQTDLDASFGAFCKVLRPKTELIDEGYFKHYFETPSYLRTIRHLAAGANINNLKTEHFENLQIPLPPLEEQKQIAAILDAADELRQKDKALIARYDELTQALFLDMFGDTWINPKGWPVKVMVDLVKEGKNSIKAGPFGSALKKEFYVPSGYKIYGQEQVIRNDLTYGDYYINEEKYNRLNSCKVKSGDILVSLVGTYGKIAIVPDVFEAGIINPRLMKISPNQEIIRPDYLKRLLQSSGVYIQMMTFSHGGTMDIMNVGIMKRLKLPIPPKSLQDQYASQSQVIESQKAVAQKSLNKSADLFNNLLQKAFKGELTN
jgi:type I restriction enzyme, S subunit